MTQSKIALVTGGSRGLGKDMALNLAKKGFDVIITYQSQSAAAQEVVG
jgi:NAD(P)-dependent dehydrogenase (short-subunit alcohol dehydrogenase family)